MKNKSRWLALMLTGSMMISPLSYTRTYAAENEQQYETNLQETVEVEEADLDKKQDESQTEDAGNVKEDQAEESEKVDNSSDKSDNQNSIEAETKPNLENISENNSENNLENNSEEKDTETTGKNSGTTVSDQVADEKADNKDIQIKDETGKSESSTDSNDSTNTPEPELPPLQEAPSVTGESVKVVKEDAEEFTMFKVSESTVVEKDGKLDIKIKTNNTGFDALSLGSKDDLLKTSVIEGTKDEEGAWTFHFNVPKEKAGQTIPVSLRKSKDQTWYDKQYLWMYIPNPGETSTPDPVPNPNPAPEVNVANGIYSMDVVSSSSMFKVVDCILTAKDGKMSAVLTLSGTGYGYLYMGTKEEAASADQSSWIPYQVNEEGKYTYTVPVEALDKEIAVAAYSIKKGIWYDRALTFQSETMKKIADLNSTDSNNKGDSGNTGNNGNTGNSGTTGGSNNTGNTGTNNSAFPGGSVPGTNSGKTDGNDGKADNVSKYESDTSGSTSHVNSGTTLKDGVYTPDRFTWSGGTGKVQITCNKVTIQNGQAYATLVFSSDHYQYVKANGNKYYTTKGGGSATAVIPVALNQNNKIIGMTDKMSVAHEIEYTIFIYLAAANGGTSANGTVASTNSNQKLDEKAPEIIGLEYQSETKLDYAEYFKIYHYDQGIVLLEIDMTKDTARDPEKAEEEKSGNQKSVEDKSADIEKSSKKKVASVTINRSEDSKNLDAESKADSSAEESATQDNNGTSEQDLAAELYKGNVVKYLIVPEDVEVPVGLEQDMIIVKKPTDHTYAESDEILNMMKDLDLLDNVAAVGMKSKDCTVSEIADKMKAKDGEKNAEVAYAGTADKLKLKNLVKSEVNLALFTGDILPGAKSEETEVEAKDTDKKDSKDTEETLTLEEQTEQFEELTEKLATLGIPVLVDRSSEEKTELGKQEWIKVYGVLYGCEELTNEKFDAAVAAAEK
ncbi:hypothetical protein DXD00_08130 [Ruminococcus sp. TF10-12AC]|nr:hypothetical protein DXD07_08795 [Ruminococcus sp. TF10-6]RGI15139.1 hypothetical protein DXD00_08130 [Ruminococcus sp. TF10-12AC]